MPHTRRPFEDDDEDENEGHRPYTACGCWFTKKGCTRAKTLGETSATTDATRSPYSNRSTLPVR
jgi:hypothetical protein